MGSNKKEKPLKITKQKENGLYLIHFDKKIEIRTIDGKKNRGKQDIGSHRG